MIRLNLNSVGSLAAITLYVCVAMMLPFTTAAQTDEPYAPVPYTPQFVADMAEFCTRSVSCPRRFRDRTTRFQTLFERLNPQPLGARPSGYFLSFTKTTAT